MELPRGAIEALSRSSGVKAVEEDLEMSVTQDLPWGLDRIDQCELPLSNTATKMDASGVRVYILDTGVKVSTKNMFGWYSTYSSLEYSYYVNMFMLLMYLRSIFLQ